jgi:hypothetical protein
MSGRGASGTVSTEVAKSANRPFHLFELYLSGGTTARSTDAYRTIVWGGNSYPALGHTLNFDGIEETAELQVSQVRVTQTGVDSSYLSLYLTHDYIDRRLVIRKAFLASDETIMVDPIPIFDGRCDAPEMTEDPDAGTCTIALTASSHWVDFNRAPGRHTNHEEQQIWFPGDMGFEFISQLNRELSWGR